jgi:hypothetical protein
VEAQSRICHIAYRPISNVYTVYISCLCKDDLRTTELSQIEPLFVEGTMKIWTQIFVGY